MKYTKFRTSDVRMWHNQDFMSLKYVCSIFLTALITLLHKIVLVENSESLMQLEQNYPADTWYRTQTSCCDQYNSSLCLRYLSW